MSTPADKLIIGSITPPGFSEPLDLCFQSMDAATAAELGVAFSFIEPWVRYPFSSQALEAYLAAEEPGAPRKIIKLGDTIVGALGLRLNWLRGHYIQFLGVLPGAQGMGIGGSVIAWLARETARTGGRNLWVAASEFNEGALRLYERHGFARLATLEDLIMDGRDEILLRRRL